VSSDIDVELLVTGTAADEKARQSAIAVATTALAPRPAHQTVPSTNYDPVVLSGVPSAMRRAVPGVPSGFTIQTAGPVPGGASYDLVEMSDRLTNRAVRVCAGAALDAVLRCLSPPAPGNDKAIAAVPAIFEATGRTFQCYGVNECLTTDPRTGLRVGLTTKNSWLTQDEANTIVTTHQVR
jgi:hypothetical protein